ncbi:MAG: diaminopimelate epimerase [Cellvibrionaceae bacterium]|nr:diaminopimelate epimerase [Cellvibrionaceae bacterium]
MRLRFTKMHGLGNDFVMIDAVSQRIRLSAEKVRKIADRRFGVGCDQLLIVEIPSRPDVDFKYRIFNCDGSEVENCGNGARCFAKFVRERKLTGKKEIKVETKAGVLLLKVQDNGDVSVDMGKPELSPAQIPFDNAQEQSKYRIALDHGEIEIGAVSMGNPHAVTVIDSCEKGPIEEWGPQIEAHARFPQKVNAGFMELLSRQEVNLRVFERGVGETLACGTGACAAVVSGRLQGLLDEKVKVNLPGGSLQIDWPGRDQPVIMTGPATTVYHGQIKI